MFPLELPLLSALIARSKYTICLIFQRIAPVAWQSAFFAITRLGRRVALMRDSRVGNDIYEWGGILGEDFCFCGILSVTILATWCIVVP